MLLDREPNLSLKAGAYWSVYEFTDRTPGSRRSAGVEEALERYARICWHTIFICREPMWYDKLLKHPEFMSRQAAIRRVTSTAASTFMRNVKVIGPTSRYRGFAGGSEGP